MAYRVLVTDDMPVNLMIASGLLEGFGLSCDTAASGEECLDKTLKNDYAAILLDYRMPDMDGEMTLKRLKSEVFLHIGREIPVIAMTGEEGEDAREKFLGLGFCEYIKKPIEPEELKAVLSRFMELSDDEKKSASGNTDVIRRLKTIDLLSVEDGIRHCGNEELYLDALKIFSDSASARAAETDRLYRDNDIKGFGIKVHAIKSTLRAIGASDLSDFAAGLEAAADGGSVEYINENAADFLSELTRLSDALSGIISEPDNGNFSDKTDDKPAITDAQLSDAYRTLNECLSFFDYDSMKIVLDSLSDFNIAEEEKKVFDEIASALLTLDRDRMKELLSGKVSSGEQL